MRVFVALEKTNVFSKPFNTDDDLSGNNNSEDFFTKFNLLSASSFNILFPVIRSFISTPFSQLPSSLKPLIHRLFFLLALFSFL
jgi:hypothetical protein